MKAVVQRGYGDPSVLELREVDRPAVGHEDVLVRVRAASVHPDVWHVVTGRPYAVRLMGSGLLRPKYTIPGTDMAGVVESVGRGVTRFRVGDEVFGETMTTHQWTSGGAFAEYVAARQEWLAAKPPGVTFEEAASVPTSGYIALINLRGASRDLPGKKVLVNGAGGGVGTLAVQICKAYGAHVTAVDSTAKLDMLRSHGADEVVDYAREDFTKGGDRYDLIFDVPGNHPFSACRRVLAPKGRYVRIGHDRFGRTGTRMFGIFPEFVRLMLLATFVKELRGPGLPVPSRQETLAVLKDLLEDGRIRPVIDSVYPLAEAGAALRHLAEDETLGKVIVAP